jgi:hypothetical protein
MAKVRLKFYGNDDSENHSLECYPNYRNEIFININMEDSGVPESWICLDIPTAIKLSKVLRQSINEIKGIDNE